MYIAAYELSAELHCDDLEHVDFWPELYTYAVATPDDGDELIDICVSAIVAIGLVPIVLSMMTTPERIIPMPG